MCICILRHAFEFDSVAKVLRVSLTATMSMMVFQLKVLRCTHEHRRTPMNLFRFTYELLEVV